MNFDDMLTLPFGWGYYVGADFPMPSGIVAGGVEWKRRFWRFFKGTPIWPGDRKTP